MAKTNKYAFDKHYYNGLYKQGINGNAARKISVVEDGVTACSLPDKNLRKS